MTYTVLRILTYVLGIVGSALVIPLGVAIFENEDAMIPVFLAPMVLAWGAALIFLLRARGKPKVVGIQDAFGVVGILWVAICVFGAIPLYFCGGYPSVIDALFESVSGFTTTGATVLADVEKLPRSVNIWRCLTHWLGGLGVVALAVAMIPLLGAGGFRLIKAEATGPDKAKFTASIATTAKILWFIYFGFTALVAVLLWYVGLDPIDALCHAFATFSTGGFSSRNLSVGSFGIPAAEWICTVFMLLGSVNFMLFCRLFTGRVSDFFRNSELRVFTAIVFISVAVIAIVQTLSGDGNVSDVVRDAAFQVASVITSTGFMTNDYTTWAPASQIIIIMLLCVGGCSGSTAGGVKVVRWMILGKQFINELRRLLHPYEVFALRLNGVAVRDSVVPAVAAFMFAYFLLAIFTALLGAIAGLDLLSAITGGFSIVGNIGPAFGSLGPSMTYGDIPAWLKVWYMIAMLAGRLEIYTLLILLGGFSRFRHKEKFRK